MGTVESRLEQTDWEASDGGLTTESPSVAGTSPTHDPKTVTMTKVTMTNSRNFNVKDDGGNVICVTRAVPTAMTWFEIESPDGKKKLSRILKVGKISSSWIVLSYINPAFSDQSPDPNARTTSEFTVESADPLYRMYEVKISTGKTSASVHPFVPDDSGKEKCGVPGKESVLRIEKVGKGFKEEYQTSMVGQTNLVSHWSWDNGLTEHNIKLIVAKGTDLGLHVALAVLVNVVKDTEKFPFVGVLTN